MSNYDIVTKYREFMKERRNNMMNPEHIVARYRMAKESDRKQRILDLADENHCNVQTIKDILLANGVDEEELPHKGRKKKVQLPPLKEIDIKVPPLPYTAEDEEVAEEKPFTFEEVGMQPPLPKEHNSTQLAKQRVGLAECKTPILAESSLLDQMLADLTSKIQPLQDEIDKMQDEINMKQKKLDVMINAYAALMELQTVTKEGQ